jgi:hypothetical protein
MFIIPTTITGSGTKSGMRTDVKHDTYTRAVRKVISVYFRQIM